MPSSETPEFLAWSLARPCELRQIDGWEDPERTERQLRAARAFGDAAAEGRWEGDLCVLKSEEPPLAFHVAEALQIYGGADAVIAACQGCPANVLACLQPGRLAGCYGEVPLPQPAAEFYQRLEAACLELNLEAEANGLFPSTQPRWFGWWMESPLVGQRAALLGRIVNHVCATDEPWPALVAALEIAATGEFPLHARLYPRGTLEGRTWRLAPYCVHCRAELADLRRCQTCGASKLPTPPLTRHVRGTRPYRPLTELGVRPTA